jgi:hypothetical protein
MNLVQTDPGRWLGRAFAIMRGKLALAGVAIGVLAAIGVAGDLASLPSSAVNLLLLPVSLFFQYELTLAGLAKSGLAQRPGRRRLWALLGLGILNGLGVLLGLVLLILPGLYLYVRWSLAAPILIAEGVGPADALTRSGQEVSGRFWPVAGLFVLIGIPWLAGLTIAVLPARLTLLSSLLTNGLVYLSIVMSWCAAVAVYCDNHRDERLSEVFA